MEALVIDLTHGGILISEELLKLGFSRVYAYDIYNTLKDIDRIRLIDEGVELINDLDEFNFHIPSIYEKLYVIFPVHCPVDFSEVSFGNIEVEYFNFHEINRVLLKDWDLWRRKNNKFFIEVTGVKGKTSTVSLINSILSLENNVLFLSSLGSFYNCPESSILLKKNISINPTSLVESVNLCNSRNFEDYDYILSECSLGVSGLSDVSVLTNIVDNYSIAKGTKTACDAKRQVFNSKINICEYETLIEYYPNEFRENFDKINSFSLFDSESNVIIDYVNYSVDSTKIKVKYSNIKTIDNKLINGHLEFNTFAPGEYNVLNILAATTTCLTLNIKTENIIKGMNNFKGIPGRTVKKEINNSIILEEINPGLNVKSIKKSIEMVNKLDNYTILLGGKYGVTCEEIDEEELVSFLEEKIKDKTNIILTDELGKNIHKKLNYELPYYEDYNEILDLLIKNEKNVLFIYRSNYSDLDKR